MRTLITLIILAVTSKLLGAGTNLLAYRFIKKNWEAFLLSFMGIALYLLIITKMNVNIAGVSFTVIMLLGSLSFVLASLGITIIRLRR